MATIANNGFNPQKQATMKKFSYYLFVALLASTVACTVNDLDEVEITPDKETTPRQTITIHSNLPEITKAIHGTEEGATSFSWEAEEDQIGVRLNDDFYYDGKGYRFTNTTDGEKATFVLDHYDAEAVPTVSVGDTFVSYYPYGTALFYEPSYDESWIGRPILRNALGALLQKGDNNTEHLYRGDYMFSRPITLTAEHFDAEGNVNVQLEFGHIFSKMRFTVKNSTSRTQHISSLVYRSTKEDDVMMGTLYLDASTGEFLTPTFGEWGDVTPNNSSVLEVQDVTIAPGESATLWMWLMPHDFSEGNPDGRSADIMINTQEGVYRVQDVHFNQRMVAGHVYRQGLELTDEKLLSDYAYISDPNFAFAVFERCMYDQYIYDPETETETIIPAPCTEILYDLALNPYTLENEEEFRNLNTGCYLKISEAAKIENFDLNGNALSIDGMQYFTGLKELSMSIAMDTSSPMSLKALKFSTLTNLEYLSILQAQVVSVDLSHNTKLNGISFQEMPLLEEIIGLDKLPGLNSLYLGTTSPRFSMDLSSGSALKRLSLGYGGGEGIINLSNLQLDYLEVASVDNIVSDNLTVTELINHSGEAFPSGAPQGVRILDFSLFEQSEHTMFEQLADMTEIESLELGVCAAYDSSVISFTAAQSSVKTLEVSQDSSEYGENPPSGWHHLTGVETLTITSKWSFTESNPLDLSAMTQLQTLSLKASKLTAFSAPPAAKSVVMNIYNTSSPSDITFSSDYVEDLEILTSGTITIGSCPKAKDLYLVADNRKYEDYAVTLGSCPVVEKIIFDVDNGTVEYKASSYPMVKSLQLTGKRITSVPSATMMPALESLHIGSYTNSGSYTGIAKADLTGFENLTTFRVPMLDETGYYSKYNNRCYNAYGNMVVRGEKAFTITEAQLATAKEKAKIREEQGNYTLPYYEGIDYEAGTPVYYKVNTVYKVVDSAGEEVVVTDTDDSDGECTSLVKSENT